MQRFARDSHADLSESAPIEAYEERIATIRKFFPPSVAAVYALPRKGADGALEWWTDGQGEVRPFAALDEADQGALLQAYHAQQRALETLARSLENRDATTEAEMVRGLIGPAITAHLYSVEGQPLVTRWGRPVPAAVHAQADLAALPQVLGAGDFSHWRWVMALAFLLALGTFFLWRSMAGRSGEAQHTTVCIETDDSAASTTSPIDQAPEFIIVLDTSGSMELNIKTPNSDELDALRVKFGVELNKIKPTDIPKLKQWLAGPSRASVAQQSLQALIQNLPETVETQLITFRAAACDAPINHGKFAAHERSRLTQLIQDAEFAGGTPLADSLELAAASIDGKHRDAIVLMFVDGADGCDRDICSVARDIASHQPRLKVNLVDISGAGLSTCVAQATNGRVYTSQDAREIGQLLKEATAPVSKLELTCAKTLPNTSS